MGSTFDITSDLEIRKLPFGAVKKLTNILDDNRDWKKLMALIRKDPDLVAKYTFEHVRMIEVAADNQRKSCSEIFLDEWGTSGRKRPTVGTLLNYLIEAELFRAADYVSCQLMRSDEFPQRPENGPAARVEIPSVENSTSDMNVYNYCNTESSTLASLPEEQFQISETVQLMDTESKIREIKYYDLVKWSNNFSHELGTGGFGKVFFCKSPVLDEIAVKKLNKNSFNDVGFDTKKNFINEISIISSLNHRNVLPLIGYSTDGPELCLIFNYMPNGSLLEKLKSDKIILNWLVRLDIAIGTAEGIDFLHSHSPKPLIHRDIKSANILLDVDLTPKVCDFGLTRKGSSGDKTAIVTSTIIGTSAYMSPEALRGDISTKMDVYSFGVVLLELVTGLPPYDEDRESCDIVTHIENIDDIEDHIDSRPDQKDKALAHFLYEVSLECLKDKKNRPTMRTVLIMLSSIPR